jgi:hypothetical protein
MRSATAHKVGTVQRAAQSLLQEEVQDINGLALIKAGKGFKLYQSRVKTDFSRGLGTETYEALWEYIHSVCNMRITRSKRTSEPASEPPLEGFTRDSCSIPKAVTNQLI